MSTAGSPALALIALAATIALLYYGRIFLITLVCSAIFAFILEPLVVLFMRARLPRALASLLVCGIAGTGLYLVGLGVYTQVATLLDDLPEFSGRVNVLLENVARNAEQFEKSAYDLVPQRLRREPPPEPAPPAVRRRRAPDPVVPPAVQEVRIRREPTPLYRYVYDSLRDFYDVLLMASFVPFLLYFMLSWRDHVHRSLLSLFADSETGPTGRTWAGVAEITRGYVVGNFQLGLLLSTASFLFFASMDLPYSVLTGPLSGFLSLVPYVGLPLAIVPPCFAALAVYTTLTPYVAIALAVSFFHLIALNLLYPKLVGSRVHLNPLMVTIALMFWGTLWGAVGLVLAIPITAGIKAVCDNVPSLEGFGRLLGDSELRP